MARALKTAAIVVGAVALGVATLGVGSALAAGFSLSAALSTAAATTIAGIGISAGALGAAAAGLGVVAGLVAKKPSPVSGGSQTEFSADPRAGVPYAIGRTGTKGNIVLRRASDGWSANTPNDLNDIITILSGAGPIHSIESFTSDKVPISFDGVGNAIGDFRDKMFQRVQLGLCPEPAALTVQAGISGGPAGWTSAHKLSGLAAAIWRLRYDSKQRFFQNGVPAPLWVIKAVLTYDPRRDSTYPGGSGPQRWDDEGTWEWSENPYLHALTWCIGRHQNGKRVMGLGAHIDQIIVPQFVEGASIAEVNGWTIGGVVYSRPDTKWNVLKLMLQAGAGEPLRVGARIGCMINTPRVSLATITAADIVGEAEMSGMQSIRTRLNSVIPRYRSEQHDWEIVPAAPVTVPAYVDQDGDERTREIEYALVQNADQAATLARYDIEDTREAGPGSFPLKPAWLNYKGGDCLTLDLPDVEASKILLLTRDIDPPTAVVTFTVRTETDSKHAAALGQSGTAPPEPPPPTVPDFPTPGSGDWTLSTGVDGFYATLIFEGACTNSNVTDIIFSYRVDEVGSPWITAATEDSSITTRSISGMDAGATYYGGVQYRVGGQVSDRVEIGPVTTDTEVIIDGSIF